MKPTVRIAAAALACVTPSLGLVGPAAAQLPPQVAGTPVPTLAPMLKRTSPAVVNIATRGTVRQNGYNNPLLQDPFFRRFFEIPEQPREREFRSAGSGVIVDAKNGYIITNAHVVKNA
jgi:S1-C subfamily serine protease